MQVEQVTEIYTQERDCEASEVLPELNTISLKTVNNGVGSYVVISTERWALDLEDVMQLMQAIHILLKRANS